MAGHAKRKQTAEGRDAAGAAATGGRSAGAGADAAAAGSVNDAKDLTGGKPSPKKKTAKKRKRPVKAYARTKEFQTVRAALIAKATDALGELDPLQLDRVDEIMDLWCQRQMLRDDVRRRGPTVLDERGRESENRCISLGLQVSKQILELYKALGLVTEPARAQQGKADAEEIDEEDDDL